MKYILIIIFLINACGSQNEGQDALDKCANGACSAENMEVIMLTKLLQRLAQLLYLAQMLLRRFR